MSMSREGHGAQVKHPCSMELIKNMDYIWVAHGANRGSHMLSVTCAAKVRTVAVGLKEQTEGPLYARRVYMCVNDV